MVNMTTERFISLQIVKASNEWWNIQCVNPFAEVYLYYKSGELMASASDTTPEGYSLAGCGRLKPNLTLEQQTAHIATVARRLPFLPA